MSWETDFPRLHANNHRVTSPATPDYNCVAWAAEDTQHWWQPGEFWNVPNWPEIDVGVGALEQAFSLLGYRDCGQDVGLEDGFTKIALYGSGLTYTHAARQLPTGKWTSKLGKGEDIEHDQPEDVAGGLYGEIAQIMKRPIVT
jgi:hypothetical protein